MQRNSTIEISVIIPTYNAADKLKECLDALEKQHFPRDKYEIIVVDDGSTDTTASIVKGNDAHYFYQNNKGPASARNKGAKVSKGDIILFTDADCVPDNNWIKELTACFHSPEIAGVKGAYKTAQRTLWARFAQIEFNERYKLLLKKKYIDMVDTYSAGYRKDIFMSLGGFDTSFPDPNGEDADLSYKLSLNDYKMVFNPKAVVWHNGHPDSLKKYVKLKFWRGYWRMVLYKRYSTKMIKDSYTPQTLKFQILIVFLAIFSLILISLFPLLMFYIFFFCVFLFIVSLIPFMVFAINQDIVVGLLSPFFLFFRAISIGFGSLYNLFNRFHR